MVPFFSIFWQGDRQTHVCVRIGRGGDQDLIHLDDLAIASFFCLDDCGVSIHVCDKWGDVNCQRLIGPGTDGLGDDTCGILQRLVGPYVNWLICGAEKTNS